MGKIPGARRQGHGPRRCHRAERRSLLECLEPRLLLATLVVNTTADDTTPDGTLSLREAIEVSNGTLAFSALSPQEQGQVSGDLSQASTIDFDIPGMSVPVIEPTSALPEITQPVTIDGTSQPGLGFVGLDGSGAGSLVDGLTISAGSSTVKGLVIVLFNGSGIHLTGAGGDFVSRCVLGTDLLNDPGIGNTADGVFIDGSANNTIGGTETGAGNIISGNANNGVALAGAGATGNVIQDDFIGTDVTGKHPLGNFGAGIAILQNASNNLIGGATVAARNVISGNGLEGISISGSAAFNLVQGNDVGTDVDGSSILSNTLEGIEIDGASKNTIGGAEPGARNLISGNAEDGIFIFSSTDGTDTTANTVQGNWIGLAASGTAALANLGNGVLISNAQNNLIGGTAPGAGNVISGNGHDGIELADGASGILIEGNKIGTDPSGTSPQSNVEAGVFVLSSSGNVIGGTAPGAGNLISGNTTGVEISGSSGGTDQVLGNRIGTDLTGTKELNNITEGILIEDASGVTIGGTTPAAANVISGNGGDGLMIANGSTAILVQGNDIGADTSGTQNIANTGNGITLSGAIDVTIGGTVSGAGNIIGGNDKDGIAIEFVSTGTLIEGNHIGLDITGNQPIMNFGNGVSVDNSSGTTIGGTTSAARNLISANAGDGVKITTMSDTALVEGNYIGTDVTGAVQLANFGNGVEVNNLAQDVTIGGTTAAARNIISGNQGSGVVLSFGSGVGNTVQGNFIGTDVSGAQALGNKQYGVLISQSEANVIGGATPSAFNVVSNEQNVISGNHLAGVFILGNFAMGNLVEGNLIGTDSTGTLALPNQQAGVAIGSAATGNTIGGTTHSGRNVISGNLTDGVDIARKGTSGNTVEGNEIGTDATGLQPLGNFLRGIFIQDASNNTVGGTTLAAANVISGNGEDGITITNSDATGNVIAVNAIGTDGTATRIVDAAGNRLGNGGNGISIIAAPLNTIALNVISGNSGNGISIANLTAPPGQAITIVANIIGSDFFGTLALGNGGDGILLDNVTNEVIGGTAAIDFNQISANHQAGIEIQGAASSANLVEGNKLGTNYMGTASLANAIGVNVNGAPDNTIEFNLISGNSLAQGGGIGVQILGTGAAGNLVLANYIGTDITGTQSVPNDIGVLVSGAPGNSIALNLISGNVRADTSGIGVEIAGTSAANNLVQSNKIGTDKTGTRTLVAQQADLGILLNDTPGNNTVGGTGAGDGNVISGFKVAIEIFAAQSQFNPTPGSTVQGNKIGTDLTGEVALGNDVGIYINGVPRNLIGGPAPGAGNVISGNTIGIYLLGSTTTGNQVQGNLIGLDAAGKVPLGNYIGVYLDAATANLIGGTTPAARNFIAGDKRNGADGSTGVYLFDKARNNQIQNNNIGTTATGRGGKGLGMGDYGVLLFNAPTNNVVRSGKAKNKIVSSGIAAFREFTGSTSAGKAVPSGTQIAAATSANHVPHGPQRFLHTASAGARHGIHRV